jgi:eukaryotic-like serine/threonine-protein kinase
VYCGAALAPLPAPATDPGFGRRPARDPRIGETVAGRFKVEELIGQGGMGKVYRARHLALDRLVCLKMLKPALLEDASVVGRFEREAMAASRLNHPNSIQVLDFGRNDTDGALYIVMEHVNGKDLRLVLRDEWPIPEERLCNIMAQVLAALGEAHTHHVIHRDLKPENVMVEQRRDHPDYVKVLDFGIAKILDSDLPALTRSDVVCGTPQYMAPEQATGGQLDGRCDLYAVGIILYQMVTGELPFDGPNSMDVLTRQVNEAPVPPRRKQPNAPISAAMESLILRVLSKDPALRPQSAEELRQLLLAIPRRNTARSREEHDATPPRGTEPRTPVHSGWPAPATPAARPGSRWVAKLAAGCAIVALATAAAILHPRSGPRPPAAAVTSAGTASNAAAARANELVRQAAQSGDPAEARDLLVQAIAIDPDNAEAHFLLGGLLVGSDPARSEMEYQAANRLDPARYGDRAGATGKGP